MQVIGTQVIPDQDGALGFTVEFVGEGGEVVSVQLRNDAAQTLNRINAVDKARALMVQLAAFDTDTVEVVGAHDAQGGTADGKDAGPTGRSGGAGDPGAMEDQLDGNL